MFFDKVSKWIDESVIYNSTGGGISASTLNQLKGFTAVDTPVGGAQVSGDPVNQLVHQATWTVVQRNAVFNKIDQISGMPLADKIKSTILADAFFDFTGSHAMSFKYVDDERPDKSATLTKDIKDFLKRTSAVEILKDCISVEGMDYGEIFLSTPVEPGIGITEVIDDLDVREHLAIYKNTELVGALKFDVQGNGAKGRGFLRSRDISHFMLGYKKKAIRISKKFADKYNIAEKVRVAEPILANVYDLIQQYNALVQLRSALELIKATQGVYLGIGVSPQQDQERVAKQLQEFTLKFNRNRQNVIDNIDNIDISTLMQSMNKLEFVPFSVEEGTNAIKQVEVKFAENNLNDILNDLRKSIAMSVGIPEQAFSTDSAGVRGTKEDNITTNPTYSKVLTCIQQLIAKGMRDMLYKHLKYRYMNEQGICTMNIDKSCIEVLFSSTVNLNDRLEDENMLLKAETVGRMLSVLEGVASSGVIPVKIAGQCIVDYWKAQVNKDVNLRNALELMTEEEQRQLQLMTSGGYIGDEGDIEEEPDADVEDEQPKHDKDDIEDTIDKKEEAVNKEEEETSDVEQSVDGGRKTKKKTRRTRKESADIRDIFQ